VKEPCGIQCVSTPRVTHERLQRKKDFCFGIGKPYPTHRDKVMVFWLNPLSFKVEEESKLFTNTQNQGFLLIGIKMYELL